MLSGPSVRVLSHGYRDGHAHALCSGVIGINVALSQTRKTNGKFSTIVQASALRFTWPLVRGPQRTAEEDAALRYDDNDA